MRADSPRPAENRVVIDTNIWLSAALSPGGSPARLVARVLKSGVPVFSEQTFAELQTRIWRPKFDRYLSMATRQAMLHDARALAHWVQVPADLGGRGFSRDADDDKFVQAALAGGAMWLVSGDADLLSIEGDVGVTIVSAAGALALPQFCP